MWNDVFFPTATGGDVISNFRNDDDDTINVIVTSALLAKAEECALHFIRGNVKGWKKKKSDGGDGDDGGDNRYGGRMENVATVMELSLLWHEHCRYGGFGGDGTNGGSSTRSSSYDYSGRSEERRPFRAMIYEILSQENSIGDFVTMLFDMARHVSRITMLRFFSLLFLIIF